MSPRQLIADNVARVRDEISAACESAGRARDAVRLVAVSKYVDAATTACLLAAGCTDLGESRPQQLWEKAALPALASARWHLVGHLQRNKLKRTLEVDALIHSVDSERLLTAISNEASLQNRPARILLEVNCSGEAAKHGLEPDQAAAACELAANSPGVELLGLMTMAAHDGRLTTARKNFAALLELRERLQPQFPQLSLAELSMGMSDDFPVAIAEGATLVRIGSRLFAGVNETGSGSRAP